MKFERYLHSIIFVVERRGSQEHVFFFSVFDLIVLMLIRVAREHIRVCRHPRYKPDGRDAMLVDKI